jgi:hypothetical protein
MVENLMRFVALFIGVAIFLGLGVSILDSTVTDCSNLVGFDSVTPSDSTGWASACESNNEQTRSAYALMMIILIVISAVVVLAVVKLL